MTIIRACSKTFSVTPAELHDLEVGSPAAEKIRIALADNVRLSAVDLKALEPFVDFYQN